MVKFIYEVATKRDQYRYDIKQNRASYDKFIANLLETPPPASAATGSQTHIDMAAVNRFPNDDIVKHMVAMSQLIRKLLNTYHQKRAASSATSVKTETSKSSSKSASSSSSSADAIQQVLTRIFYTLIDLYETHMTHAVDVLNAWSDVEALESFSSSDSIHLYMFDLIHLIGAHFIQESPASSSSPSSETTSLRRRNQQLLLEKIMQKLTAPTPSVPLTSSSATATATTTSLVDEHATPSSTSSSSSSSARRQLNMQLTLARNKLLLMTLCAQYVTPNDLELFNQFYVRILTSIGDLLASPQTTLDAVTTATAEHQHQHNNQQQQQQPKLAIVLQLLAKFSFASLKKLLADSKQQQQQQQQTNICTEFVQINMRFLLDLSSVSSAAESGRLGAISSGSNSNNKERQLRPIVEQCVDNMVSILHVDYPLYFDYMLKRCLEFSCSPATSKYGAGHWTTFVTIMRQHELLFMYNNKGYKLIFVLFYC